MPTPPGLAYWVAVLTGIDEERVVRALCAVQEWRLEHVTAELCADSVDAAVAATLLVEDIDELEHLGVPRERLLKKLRRDRKVWPTWAEIRVAVILSRPNDGAFKVQVEPGKERGAHADWRFVLRDDDFDIGTTVEVKAVGLSEKETAFSARMSPTLRRLLPREGLIHGHADIASAPAQASGQVRKAGAPDARRAARQVPGYPRGLRGAVIVGHDSEQSYALRVAAKVNGTVRQLPTDEECWIAIYWSNGASTATVRRQLDWSVLPAHVRGVILVGCGVAFPHRQIHCYSIPIARDDHEARLEIKSLDDEHDGLAALVLDRFENSSGVRPTLLRVGNRDLLHRDGRRPILPFNLLMDVDPTIIARS